MTKYYKVVVISCTLPFVALVANHSNANEQVNIDFSAGLEYGYDDNVIVEEIDLNSSAGDNFYRFKGKFDIEYKPADEQEFSFGVSLNDLNYNDNDSFDLQTILATVGYKYEVNEMTYALDFRHADAELGGEGFLTLTQISPSVSTFFSRQHFVRAAFTYMQKELDNNPDRDTDSSEFSADYYYFKNGLTQFFILSAKLRGDDAENDQFDFMSYQFRGAFKQRYSIFEHENQLTLEVVYRDRDYDEVINQSINDFRRDKRTVFTLENKWTVTDSLDVSLEYKNINNDSNLSSFDFTENRYAVSFDYSF